MTSISFQSIFHRCYFRLVVYMGKFRQLKAILLCPSWKVSVLFVDDIAMISLHHLSLKIMVKGLMMSRILFSLVLATFSLCGLAKFPEFNNRQLSKLAEHQWRSGAEDCRNDSKPAIEIYRYDSATFILRQNKCVHYEAPFIYVLFGQHTVFIQDTGATKDAEKFPLYQTVMTLVFEVALNNGKSVDDYHVLVTHSHGHSDHYAADAQFIGKPGVTLIEPNLNAVKAAFGYLDGKLDWPQDKTQIDLGGRVLTLMPIPGHKNDAVAVFDEKTHWLLTGDSLYPGRLYVKDWLVYKKSIARLVKWTQSLNVSAIMGTHIEMSDKPGIDYKMGSTYQPNEARLVMPYQDLLLLQALLNGRTKPKKVVKDRFIVYPVD